MLKFVMRILIIYVLAHIILLHLQITFSKLKWNYDGIEHVLYLGLPR